MGNTRSRRERHTPIPRGMSVYRQLGRYRQGVRLRIPVRGRNDILCRTIILLRRHERRRLWEDIFVAYHEFSYVSVFVSIFVHRLYLLSSPIFCVGLANSFPL